MPKPSSFTASAISNSNIIVATTESDWSHVRPGSLFKFFSDDVFYTVGSRDCFFYARDFSVLSPKQIRIESNTGIILQKNDTLTISYKEYELLCLIEIIEGGKGYKKDEIISVEAGTLSKSIDSGLSQPCLFKIIEVDENGKILVLGPESRGIYIDILKETPFKVRDGSGSEAILGLQFRTLDDRKIIERTITLVQLFDNYTILTLDYPVSEGLKNGKFSTNKWKIFLTGNYLGKDKINEEYEISRDFTPNLKLPLLSKGSLNHEEIFNRSMTILDGKIKELEGKINK